MSDFIVPAPSAAPSAAEVQMRETPTATPGSPPVASPAEFGSYRNTVAEQNEDEYDVPYQSIDDNAIPHVVIPDDKPYQNIEVTGGHYENVEDTYLQPTPANSTLKVAPPIRDNQK